IWGKKGGFLPPFLFGSNRDGEHSTTAFLHKIFKIYLKSNRKKTGCEPFLNPPDFFHLFYLYQIGVASNTQFNYTTIESQIKNQVHTEKTKTASRFQFPHSSTFFICTNLGWRGKHCFQRIIKPPKKYCAPFPT
ncbi:hypothetical protein, partial [Leeuwenhoekiella sp. UBA6783]|uniref:hypothetical protein n=1 Tax=Leeuwenhoekiella sp. UBA6783 TaxID=1946747 RepID=UPI0025C4CC9B